MRSRARRISTVHRVIQSDAIYSRIDKNVECTVILLSINAINARALARAPVVLDNVRWRLDSDRNRVEIRSRFGQT